MRTKKPLILSSLFLLLLALIFLSLSLGDSQLDLAASLRYLLGQGDSADSFILGQIRLPRILACLLAGASLGLAGNLLQTFTRNPLADSGTLGINAGAGVVVALVISQVESTSPFFIRYLPFLALLGGLATVYLVYFLSHKPGETIRPVKLILTGVILSTILTSSIMLITGRVDPRKLTYMVEWLSGKLMGTSWDNVSIAAPILILLWLLIYSRAYRLNILNLSDETAQGLGLSIKRERFLLLFLSSSLVAFSLTLAGNIAFVGLLASHLSRRLLGQDHRLTLPASMLLGALVLLLADTLTRAFLIGSGLPTGILVSLIGAPYFLYLMKIQAQ